MRMGSLTRKLPVFLVLAAGLALGGCENQALLQWFDNKPKLKGTRVPVFPEGVPGVQQGVPPELMKGYQSQIDQQTQVETAAEEARKAEEEKKRAQAEAAERRKAQQAARATQPRPARRRTQPVAAESRPATEPAPAPQAQHQPTSAPLADRWPSDSQPQQQQQQQRQQQQSQQPQYSSTRPWPGSAPSAGPPTDRFSR